MQNICYRAKPLQVLITDQCNAQCNATNINVSLTGCRLQAARAAPGNQRALYTAQPCLLLLPVTLPQLHVFAFEQLAPLRVGRMNIRYRLACPPPATFSARAHAYCTPHRSSMHACRMQA